MDGKRKSPSLIEQSTDAHRSSKILRMSLTEQSTDPEKRSDLGKVCLICYCRPEEVQRDGGGYNYCVFLLDLDDESAKESSGAAFVPRDPDMCFDTISLGLSGFCLLGSTLYLFGKEKDVFSYKFFSPSHPLPEGVKMLTKGMLTNAHLPMKYAKSCPVGCQTPTGNMLVLSSLLHVCEKNCGKFELFDPAKKEWTEFPDLLPHLLRLCTREESELDICVSSYSFINNGPVLLITTQLGDFTLNTNDPDKGWSQCNEFRRVRGHYFMLVWDRLCLMDWFAMEDRPGPFRRLPYPRISGLPADCYCDTGRGMSWLSSNRFCVARALVDHATLKPHLVIDVCSFDPKDFQGEKNTDNELPGMTVMERFKFVLGPQSKRCEPKFLPSALFSIKPHHFD